MTTASTIHVDTRINARWLIPIVPAGVVLEHHALLMNEKRIAAILPQDDADRRFSAGETYDLTGHVLMPGLINAHGHAAMSLFRGMADDLPLMTWLKDHIWPAESAFIGPEFIADGTQLAIAEMLRTGTTCFSDMYLFPEVAAQIASKMGIRAQICFPMLDFPTPWGSGPQEYLNKGSDLIGQWRGDSHIAIGIGPHAPYTISDGPLEDIVALSRAEQVPVQIHLHETAGEITDALEKSGKRPTQRLADLDLLNPSAQCVHMTQVDDTDISLLQESGAHVIHCPESNLKLASGFCPVHRLQQSDINVAIGTDSAASNNDLNLFGELNTAAMLAKAVASDAAALSAHDALAMATINGARALGQEQDMGSLEVGKLADVIAIDLSDPLCQPVYDPASHLVYSQHGRQLSHSWIGGVIRVQNGHLTDIDLADLMRRVSQWAQHICQSRKT